MPNSFIFSKIAERTSTMARCTAVSLLILLYSCSTYSLSLSTSVLNLPRTLISKLSSPLYFRTYTFSRDATDTRAVELTFSQVFEQFQLRPPVQVPSRIWRWAYECHRRLLPLLHAFDSAKPPNSSLSLLCAWWKAMVGSNNRSPAYDENMAYDMLPSLTRWIIPVLRPILPRLHNANIELRTVFLNNAVVTAASLAPQGQKVRLISFGAGYDTRSILMQERGLIAEAVELDLPDVIEGKRLLLSRLQQRRPNAILPNFYSADLNDIAQTRETVRKILSADGYYNIFLFEGVMTHLKKGSPHALLSIISELLASTQSKGYLCFSDLLENVPNRDLKFGLAELQSTGWVCDEWMATPTKTPHMGRAHMQ